MPASHFALPNSNATYIVACSLSATGVSKRCEDLMASSVGWWFALQTYLSASRRHIESERSEGSHAGCKGDEVLRYAQDDTTLLAMTVFGDQLMSFLFKNLSLLDPNWKEARAGYEVLVEGDTIKEVSAKPIKAAKATVVNCGKRTL